jgi:hypothetical protein
VPYCRPPHSPGPSFPPHSPQPERGEETRKSGRARVFDLPLPLLRSGEYDGRRVGVMRGLAAAPCFDCRQPSPSPHSTPSQLPTQISGASDN